MWVRLCTCNGRPINRICLIAGLGTESADLDLTPVFGLTCWGRLSPVCVTIFHDVHPQGSTSSFPISSFGRCKRVKCFTSAGRVRRIIQHASLMLAA
eukprot:gene34502-42548_t